MFTNGNDVWEDLKSQKQYDMTITREWIPFERSNPQKGDEKSNLDK